MNREKSIIHYEFFCIIFVAILGTILHFTYDLSHQNPIVASFSSVNESVWEHLKLLFFPTLLTIMIGCILHKDILYQYLSSKVNGLLSTMWFIVIFYFTYVGILGQNIALIDILSFFVAIILSEYITLKKLIVSNPSNWKLSLAILIVLFICFIIFTFIPPKIGLFQDPITGTYGITQSWFHTIS